MSLHPAFREYLDQLNPLVVKAAAEGLKNMESPVQVAERRGISVAEMFGGKEN